MPEQLVYRVVNISNTNNSFADSSFVAGRGPQENSGANLSYCAPNTVFWLDERGIDDPNATIILLELIEKKSEIYRIDRSPSWIVEFEYDRDRYIGTYSAIFRRSHIQSNNYPSFKIYDISSL